MFAAELVLTPDYKHVKFRYTGLGVSQGTGGYPLFWATNIDGFFKALNFHCFLSQQALKLFNLLDC